MCRRVAGIHHEPLLVNGGEPLNPGIVGSTSRTPHPPADDVGTGPLVSFARSGVAARWNVLLYSPHHPPDRLERALRLAALSPGWRWSFEALQRAIDITHR